MIKTLAALVACTLFAATAAQAESVTYRLDPSHTFASFGVSHFGTSTYRGRFDKKEGSVTLDTAAKTGSVDVKIDAASVSVGLAALDTHLKGKDFLDVATYPTIEFKGDRFTFEGDKVTSVAGTLTMRGQSRPVTLKATRFNCYDNPIYKRQVCGGDFEATIQRTQWGINYLAPMPVSDDVTLLIQVEAIKQ